MGWEVGSGVAVVVVVVAVVVVTSVSGAVYMSWEYKIRTTSQAHNLGT